MLYPEAELRNTVALNGKGGSVNIPRMLRIGEAARTLHVHPNTLRKWSSEGMIPSYRIGRRRDRRFTIEDLANFLKANDQQPYANEGNGKAGNGYQIIGAR